MSNGASSGRKSFHEYMNKGLQGGIIFLAGAGSAERAATDKNFALEIDPFAAFGTDYAGTFETGKVFGVDFDLYPLLRKQNVIGQLRVGPLLAIFSGKIGEHLFGSLLRRFLGGDANGAASLQITESSGDFAPVTKFQSALAEPRVGDQRDSVGDAAIDLDVGNDALAVGDGIINSQFPQPQHGQADAKDLSGAKVSMGEGSEFEVFGKCLHIAAILVRHSECIVF
jgi:hypothetical protein